MNNISLLFDFICRSIRPWQSALRRNRSFSAREHSDRLKRFPAAANFSQSRSACLSIYSIRAKWKTKKYQNSLGRKRKNVQIDMKSGRLWGTSEMTGRNARGQAPLGGRVSLFVLEMWLMYWCDPARKEGSPSPMKRMEKVPPNLNLLFC